MSNSLRNQELSNRDMFEVLKSVNNDICQMNEIVIQNSRSVEAIKDSLRQITTILQQLTEKGLLKKGKINLFDKDDFIIHRHGLLQNRWLACLLYRTCECR